MSDVPQQIVPSLTALDFTGVVVTGLPSPIIPPALTSINGDVTPAQSLSAQTPGFVSSIGGGAHIVVYQDFVPAVPGPSAGGLVPNPGAAGATDYLAADATFKPLPGVPVGVPVIQKFSWVNADIVALGAVANGTINLVTLPARTVVLNAWLIVTGSGAGGGAFYDGNVGYGGGLDEYIPLAVDLTVAPNTIYGNQGVGPGFRGSKLDINVAPKLYNDIPSLVAGTLVKFFVECQLTLNLITGSSGDIFLQTLLLP